MNLRECYSLENQRGDFFRSSFFKDILLASLALFLMALAPHLGAVFLTFMPLPIIYYYAKYGRRKGLGIAVLSLAAVLVSLQALTPSPNLLLTAYLALAGFIIAELLEKKYSIERTVCSAALAIFTIGILFLLYQAYYLGKAPWDLIASSLEKKIRYSLQLSASLNISSEQLDMIKENLPGIISILTNIFPALFLVSLIFMVWVNLLAGRSLSRKFALPFPEFGDLSSWKAPEKMVWYLIAAGAMLLIPDARTELVGGNTLIVILFFYLLAGLAIISFYLKKSHLPAVFRYLLYFLIFAQQIVTLLVIAAGIFDLWADFRRLNTPLEEDSTV